MSKGHEINCPFCGGTSKVLTKNGYVQVVCGECEGSGLVKTGEPLGACDGPQYGTCSHCNGQKFIWIHDASVRMYNSE
jgi:DnaJ-class molecular chaperone